MGNEFVQAGDFTADGFKETEKLFKKLLMSDENFSEGAPDIHTGEEPGVYA